MRAAPLVLPLALALALALGACHKPKPAGAPLAQAVVIPGADQALASGLWVQRVADHAGVSETRICLDDAADRQLAWLGQALARRCQRDVTEQAANGEWRFATSCGAQVAEGVAHGDFSRSYEVEATLTQGAAKRRVRADISFAGPCPVGMQPGDIILPDGERTRAADLAGKS